MPGWLKDYVTSLFGPVGWLFRWTAQASIGWIEWVNSTLTGIVVYSYRSYILLTYDIANFSYYVASFTATARRWTEWIAYSLVPHAVRDAEAYAYYWAQRVRKDAQAARARLRAKLLADIAWVYDTLAKALNKEISDRKKADELLSAFLLKVINQVYQFLVAALDQERAERKRADVALRDWAAQQFANVWAFIKTILPTVDKEAAAGYNKSRADQAQGLTRLLDDLIVDNPVMRDVVGKLIGLILDLASVEDPAARIAAQFLLRQVIDRLGADKLAGGFVSDLAGVFLGGGKPSTLEDVTSLIGDRLNAGEAQWQQFYQHGGDDLEKLGDQMRQSASPVFTLAMAGYLAAAVTDPRGTAAVTDDVVTPAARAILTPLLAVLGG
jgi:hypothetical protein